MARLRPLQNGIIGEAVFDPSGIYRYWLRREWDTSKNRITFIMLNPSEANADYDDPAVIRCMDFSQKWGFGSMEIVNLFALCTSDPSIMKKHQNPVGPDNDNYIYNTTANSNIIIAAWGNDGAHRNRSSEVLHLIWDYDLYCMGLTKENQPRYPARLTTSTSYVKYRDSRPTVVAKRQDEKYLVIKCNNQYAIIKNGDKLNNVKWQNNWVLSSAIMKAGFEQIKPYVYLPTDNLV
jgi:hypothetical protein